MIFGIKRKMYNFDLYNVLLAIATNIPVLLMTGFVVQGHKWHFFKLITILTKNKVVWPEDLTEGSGSHGVHGTRLQIHQHSTGYVFAS